MRLLPLPLALAASLLFIGCRTPKLQRISPTPILNGTGGRAVTVRGVQFWQDATPARKYAVLGYVDDYWRGPALDAYDFKSLAPVVRKYGGDAGIVIRGAQPAPGLHRLPDEVGDTVLRLQVIKYL